MLSVKIMDFYLDTNKKYVIGVSGGPDSMTLLSLCVKHKIQVVVAHVNYQKRESAKRDEEIVKEFCLKHSLVCEVLYPTYESGNFQGWARDVRYAFYKELCHKYNCDGILLAHHQDDVLETYLMQLERGSRVDYYGIRECRKFEDFMVYRPLLSFSRKDIMEYVIENNIPYGIDESNLSNDYRRNQIRHDVVEVASVEQRQEWLKQISLKNKEIECHMKELDAFVDDVWLIDDYRRGLENLRLDGLRYFFTRHNIVVDTYRDVYLKELDTKILSGKNFQEVLDEKFVLDVSYGVLRICERAKEYAFVIHSLEEFKTSYFNVAFSGPSICGVYVTEDDFPLTIRNYKDGDSIELRFGHKRVSRWFVDRKIPLFERKVWPVVENKRKEVILVSQIGCNVTHYNAKYNLFVIK